MYNFSGVMYRIWGSCGVIFLLGVVCILLERPWAENFEFKKCKTGLIVIAVSVCLALSYAHSIIFPRVSSFTGEFVESYGYYRAAPPFPLTDRYVFRNGEGEKMGFNLDILSKKKIFPDEFVKDREYTVYYETNNIIVRVEMNE